MSNITTFEQLEELLMQLHDCPFDFDRSAFDENSGIWQGTFLRPLWNDPRAQHRGLTPLYGKSRLPLDEVTLKVANIQDVEIFNDQGIGRYTFSEVEHDSEGLRLRFNQALQLYLKLRGPIEATYDERPLPGRWAVYRQILLVQSGPEIEVEGANR